MTQNLAAIARDAGLKVIETEGWRTRGHPGGMGTIQTIVCHHTAGPTSGNMPSLHVVTSGRTGLPGPLSHYGLGRDGTVYVIAAGLCWHAGDVRDPSFGNAHAIGIEAEATGTAPWPEAQLDAYARLCAALCKAYKLDVSRVMGHKEVCAPRGRKVDPNFDMDSFRDRVAKHLEVDPLQALLRDLRTLAKQHGVSLVYIARVALFGTSSTKGSPRFIAVRSARALLKPFK